jgi:hypothetical protein
VKRPNYHPLFRPSKRMKLILSKLREKSTWLGIATILTAFGVPLPPEVASVVGELVQAAAGVALVAITPKK